MNPLLVPATLLVASTLLAACGPQYIKGTEIKYSDAKHEIAMVVERYRVAMEQQDVTALRSIASRDYYENGSTTTDARDDYGYDGLERVFVDLENTVKAVKYKIEISQIDVMGSSATVNYDYESQFLYTVGERDSWGTKSDKNRLTLRKEKGLWRILGGM
jgi:hypothetical protein